MINQFGYFDNNKHKYPIICIGDILIHCFHYSTHEEALKKWNERRKRMNFDNLFLIGNTWDLFNDDLMIETFMKIKRPKLLFTDSFKYKGDECICYCKEIKRNVLGVPLLLPTEYTKFRYKRIFEKNKYQVYRIIKKAYQK